MKRVALFMDYENFYTSLKERTGLNPYGTPPSLDFLQLVAFVERHFGRLEPADFIVAANFSHYNEQKGGLNKVATLLRLDSFKPGGRHHLVLKNYADMRLALEVGRHLTQNPADLYLIASGDGDFVAVAHAIEQSGRSVYFLVPDIHRTAAEIREQFACYEAPDIFQRDDGDPPDGDSGTDIPEEVDSAEVVCNWLGRLQREFSAGIPLDLLKVLLPPENAAAWVNKAYGEGRLDFWEAPNMPGVKCVSLRSARLRGQPVRQATRPELAKSGAILQALIQRSTGIGTSRKAWLQLIKETQGLPSKKAKKLYEDLTACGMLDAAYPDRLRVNMENLRDFIRRQKAA